MKMKKLLCTLLTMGMTVSAMTGCGSENIAPVGGTESVGTQVSETILAQEETKTIDTDELITVTCAGYNQMTGLQWEDTIVWQEWEKRYNIHFEGTEYDAETFKTKFPLILASDEMPDLFINAADVIDQNTLNKYGKDGYFLDFSQYLDYMPNLVALMERDPYYAAQITCNDGAIYGFPRYKDNTLAMKPTSAFISQTWLDNVGKEMPTSLEEFYNVLVAFKEKDANGNGDTTDEIPMAYYPESYAGARLRHAFGIYNDTYAYVLQADENGTVQFMDTSDNNKEWLKFMNKLYEEGLINQDAFVVTFSELKQRCQDSLVGFWGNYGSLANIDMQWRLVPSFTTDYSTEQYWVKPNATTATYTIVANADTEHPERIAMFLDYMLTPEGYIEGENGFEGISYDMVEVNGMETIDMSPYAKAAGKETVEQYRTEVVVVKDAFKLYTCGVGNAAGLCEEAKTEDLLSDTYLNLSAFNAFREYSLRMNEGVEWKDTYPPVIYTEDEAKERTVLYTDITNYIKTSYAEFITGEVDIDAGWEAFKAELNKMGLERAMKIEQAAYDRFVK